jgi:hypothetical protein
MLPNSIIRGLPSGRELLMIAINNRINKKIIRISK